jgi:transposase InsO family protein
MIGDRSRPTIPLPKQWPSRARSGVLHAISLAHFSLTYTRSWAANSWNARIRLKQENDRVRQELALVREEMRIKDSRMLRVPAQRRPHYPPTERLAILELRAARGWSRSQTARCLLVTTATVCAWMGRLDEEGPRAIVRTSQPVNKFPDFVAYIVRRLKVLCPTMGKAKIAQVFCRAGLHLWWVAVAADHYSRRVVGVAVFDQQPTSVAVRAFLGRAVRKTGAAPRHLITDQGKQFRNKAFGQWCRRRGIRQRFGAVGKYGSIAVVERLIRTIRSECTRKLLIPYRRGRFRRELSLFVDWYNGDRPSEALDGRSPNEVYQGRAPACLAPRFEPRRHWPRGSPCAAPRAGIRGQRGVRFDLAVRYSAGRKHLPIVKLNRAA